MNIIHIKHLVAIKFIIIIILAQFSLVDANAIPPTKPTTVPP